MIRTGPECVSSEALATLGPAGTKLYHVPGSGVIGMKSSTNQFAYISEIIIY